MMEPSESRNGASLGVGSSLEAVLCLVLPRERKEHLHIGVLPVLWLLVLKVFLLLLLPSFLFIPI